MKGKFPNFGKPGSKRKDEKSEKDMPMMKKKRAGSAKKMPPPQFSDMPGMGGGY